jgi:dolichyl-phosphate-mannose--protein O-mannosyl transferase
MGLRPMLYYYADNPVTGCGQAACVKAVMLIGTPAMYWISLPVLAWGIWRATARRDWRYAAAVAAYLAGFLPWFLDLDRQMYFFYAVPLAPFLMMAIALVCGDVLGPAPFAHVNGQRFILTSERRSLGLVLVCLYLGLAVANFIWLYPILTGLPITVGNWHNHLWLPSWS